MTIFATTVVDLAYERYTDLWKHFKQEIEARKLVVQSLEEEEKKPILAVDQDATIQVVEKAVEPQKEGIRRSATISQVKRTNTPTQSRTHDVNKPPVIEMEQLSSRKLTSQEKEKSFSQQQSGLNNGKITLMTCF